MKDGNRISESELIAAIIIAITIAITVGVVTSDQQNSQQIKECIKHGKSAVIKYGNLQECK